MYRARLPLQDTLIFLPFEIFLAFQHTPRQSASFLFNNQAVLFICLGSLHTSDQEEFKEADPKKTVEAPRSVFIGWCEYGMPSKGSKHLLKE